MQIADGKKSFGLVSLLNHWIIGLAVIGLLTVGVILEGMPRGPEKAQLLALHKASGVVILALALWRISWRLRSGFPELAPDHPAWQRATAKAAHWFLMIAIIAMPASGLMWSLFAGRDVSMFGLFSIPAFASAPAIAETFEFIHRSLSKALIAVIAVHVGAALYHVMADTDRTIGRMFGMGTE